MVADTWVNLVHHRLPGPNATAPPKKPEPKAVASTSPADASKSECAVRKDFGWFWVTRKRSAGPLTFTRPSLDAGSGSSSPHRVEEGPSLSRVSSGDSWLEVTRDCTDAGGSSDDLTDLEDANLVSVAPRPEPRVRSIRITSLGSAPSIGGRRLGDSEAAPAGSLTFSSSDAPEPTKMHRPCDPQQAPAGIRMRTTATKDRPIPRCSQDSRATGLNGTADQGEGNNQTDGVLSIARVAAACGVAPDSDLLWTFLAGMMLYFMSV